MEKVSYLGEANKRHVCTCSLLKKINMNLVFNSACCTLDSKEQMFLMESTVIVFVSLLNDNQ